MTSSPLTQLEWLETNGLGGFASSTLCGMNTRRYHGLLIAATQPPAGRTLLLSKLEETLVISGHGFVFSTNQYQDAVYPEGYQFLKSYRLVPFPRFVFEIEGFEIEKRIFMVQGQNTTVVEYEVRPPAGAPPYQLELRPLLAFRDFHAITHANPVLNKAFETAPGLLTFQPYQQLPKLYLAHNAATVTPEGHWYYNFEYSIERERGLESREDLFCPAVLGFVFSGPGTATVVASTTPQTIAGIRSPELPSDQFIVKRGHLETVIAGYHWFADWGRDTMIALPGLTLVTGRFDVARNILLTFASYLDQGMLPNRFPDAGVAPEYNTVDATLWFFEAIRAYLHYTNDFAFVREHLYEPLRSILNHHLQGTRYGIHVDTDGLLHAGKPGVQLTWMDAKVGDWVVTPRQGKPVEIQALWYNALRVMASLAEKFQEPGIAHFMEELAARACASFHAKFWNPDTGCLYDVVDGDTRDGSIRPNQVIALSLHNALVSGPQALQVLETVEKHLLTPYGLRTLSPADSRYRGRYEGSLQDRDAAYHQGPVWPWLTGPFVTAYVKAHGATPESKDRAAGWLRAIWEHPETTGIGQIPELLDGDAPHHPRGCLSQAWSLAEIRRAAAEDCGFVFPAP